MTWQGKPHPVGDKGQRYEVHYTNDMNTDSTFGWSSTIEGAWTMFVSINLHPSWHSPKIRDRVENRWISKRELLFLTRNKLA